MRAIKKENYLENFNSTNLESLCKIALDTRKFEIELYWKRAAYFWTFIAAALAAFALISTTQTHNLSKTILMVIITMLGSLFSFGWYLVNRGSKYWQENWEDHISILVSHHIGPIFKLLKYPHEKIYNLHKGYPYSVSKTNQILSLFTFILWLSLFTYSIFTPCYFNVTLFIISILLLGLGIYILYKYSRTQLIEDYKKANKFNDTHYDFIDARSNEEIEQNNVLFSSPEEHKQLNITTSFSSMQPETKSLNFKHTILILIFLIGIVIIISMIPTGIYYWKFHDSTLSQDPNDWGAFGAYLGGTTGVLLSICALVFSIMNIFITYKISTYIQKKEIDFQAEINNKNIQLTHLANKPYPYIDLTKTSNETSINLQNMGVGVAIISQIKIKYSTKTYDNFNELLKANHFPNDSNNQINLYTAPNFILAPQLSRLLLSLTTATHIQQHQKLRDILKECIIEIYYQDIFENKFKYKKDLIFFK